KNGTEVSYTLRTAGSGATADESSQNFHIGNRSTADKGWDGLIDEVRIYGRIITPSEMVANMNTAL
ncbi:MAG: fibronectin type III, partial [Candidatus Staskawiczbacteria bacterium]|nr:fibronectin type III [Candidatus Staskawiczbacteria bacterium]